MAITGTQADPYKPTTWEEFLSVSDTDSVYIELPEGAVFDMNDYYPEGITDTITLKGYINGNGATIKNAAYRGSTACFEVGSSTKTSLNFLDCRGELSSGFFIGSNGSIPSGRVVFNKCKFSGSVSAIGSNVPYFSWIGRTAYFNRCSFDLQLEETMLDYALYKYCNMKIETIGNTRSGYLQLDNSYLTGRIYLLEMQKYSSSFFVGDSIIDAEINYDIYWSDGTPQHLLINSDKLAEGITVPSVLTQVTTAQLKNAADLSSIGFPVQT